LVAAAGSLAGIGDTLAAQNGAAAGPTGAVVPPAADLVSAVTAAQFVAHSEAYQQIAAQAAAVHQQLVVTLHGSAGSYGLTEAANAAAAG
jgi:hypothetical protein